MAKKPALHYMIMMVCLSFLLGLITTNLIPSYADTQRPDSVLRTPEQVSPNNWITEEQIHVFSDRIVLDIKDASWAKFTDTNSMDPLFDINSNTIELKPEKPQDLKVGDIISYYSESMNALIIHRIIEAGQDSEGDYFITRGDNNAYNDPEKVRFEQVKGVVVGIIY